jgi:2-amino-4-hydroxy-6-hydroxymethyldihydropteridine diphosphokinase
MTVQKDVYISLGSNLGDTAANLRRARDEVAGLAFTEIEAASDERITGPVGVTDQPAFRNQVLRLRTSLAPEQLLEQLLEIENRMGRVRKERWGPRTIDLDILFFGTRRLDTPRLKIPHPELGNRRFFLKMVAEIEPAFLESWGELSPREEEDETGQDQG